MMELLLARETFTEQSTIGSLAINGEMFCFCLEDPVRPDGIKVFGKTAIPYGRYEVILNWSNRFGRILPLLLHVPNFEGVRIHSGNRAEDSEGCVLVGQTKGPQPNWIGNSRAAMVALMPKLTAASAVEKLWIEVRKAA